MTPEKKAQELVEFYKPQVLRRILARDCSRFLCNQIQEYLVSKGLQEEAKYWNDVKLLIKDVKV